MTDPTRGLGEDDEFYIGYAPPMPPRHSRFVTRTMVALIGGAALWAGVAAVGHVRLEGGTFEFGHSESFSGHIVERPYPALRLDAAPEGSAAVLLVASGKHGADALVRGLDGRHVTLKGTRIHRDAATMIEIDGRSITARADANPAEAGFHDQTSNPVTAGSRDPGANPAEAGSHDSDYVGEVVDSKCFLGVMVPGQGKTHKDCASLCLRGGIPPALLVRNPDGASSLLLITGPAGEPLGARVFELAGERVAMRGEVELVNGWLTLRTK